MKLAGKKNTTLVKILVFIELCRPVNCLFTGAVVWVGGILAGQPPPYFSPTLAFAALSAAFIAAGGNVYNDVRDKEIDRINRPDRPIPSGRVSIKSATVWCSLLITFGFIIGSLIHYQLGLIAAFTAVLLFDYSAHRSRSMLIGNIIVAFCAGLAFFYGALAIGNPLGGILPGLFAMLIHLGREIVKDTEDIEGDKALLAKTLPIVKGALFSQRVAAGVLLLLVLITIVPFVSRQFSDKYFYLMLPFVDVPLVIMCVMLSNVLDKKQLHVISVSLKAVMLSGLIVMFLVSA